MKRCDDDPGFSSRLEVQSDGVKVRLDGWETVVATNLLSALTALNLAIQAPENEGLAERLAVVCHEKTKADPHAWCGLYDLLGIIQDLRGEREPEEAGPSSSLPDDGGGILG